MGVGKKSGVSNRNLLNCEEHLLANQTSEKCAKKQVNPVDWTA